MIDLERFYRDTGFNRELLSKASDVSTSTLRKYERSGTDRMRRKTVAKIERTVDAARSCEMKVCKAYFPYKVVVSWTGKDGERKSAKLDQYNLKGQIKSILLPFRKEREPLPPKSDLSGAHDVRFWIRKGDGEWEGL